MSGIQKTHQGEGRAIRLRNVQLTRVCENVPLGNTLTLLCIMGYSDQIYDLCDNIRPLIDPKEELASATYLSGFQKRHYEYKINKFS